MAQAVQATMEAIPTPTPTPAPTPNIAATLQAGVGAEPGTGAPVLMLNPLDLELDRDPYLTSNELRYFRELGPRLWTYTRGLASPAGGSLGGHCGMGFQRP